VTLETNDDENSALITEINYTSLYTLFTNKTDVSNCNNISQYYYFFVFFFIIKMQPWGAEETSFKNIKNLIDLKLLTGSV